MSISREELLLKTREELVEIAAKFNIDPHHRSKPETIVEQILEQAMHLNKPKESAPQKEKPILVFNTQEQVLEAIEHYLSKDGFVCRFLPDNTWYFSFQGREESGSMSVPLSIIKIKAMNVAKGAIKLKGYGDKTGFVMWA